MIKALTCKQFGGIEHLSYESVAPPEMAPDEVLIKVLYCGVNFPDTLIIQGKYQFKPELPFIPGQEVSGEVLEVGEEVSHVSPGDMVIASMTWGGFAERVVAKGVNTYSFPDNLPFESGAVLLETYATAIHALIDRANLLAGETLVVLGAAGGTGTAAVQLGLVLGARVIAVASTEEKRAFARSQGASEVIGYDSLKSNLKKMGGADVIFDPVGGEAAEEAFRALLPNGRHLIVGFASGAMPNIPANLPLLKQASLVGVFWGGFWRDRPEHNRRNVLNLMRWFNRGKLKVGLTKTYDLKDGAKALDDLMKRRVTGKIVLKIDQNR